MDEGERVQVVTKAINKAAEELGVDPAYFGQAGQGEVERQIKLMGYDPKEVLRQVV